MKKNKKKPSTFAAGVTTALLVGAAGVGTTTLEPTEARAEDSKQAKLKSVSEIRETLLKHIKRIDDIDLSTLSVDSNLLTDVRRNKGVPIDSFVMAKHLTAAVKELGILVPKGSIKLKDVPTVVRLAGALDEVQRKKS